MVYTHMTEISCGVRNWHYTNKEENIVKPTKNDQNDLKVDDEVRQ